MRLSVYCIARNEESGLPVLWDSVSSIADELVVCDTGSEDGTVAVAERLGAKVVHFEWCDDFSVARNYAIEHCTGDWILQLDCDETLYPASAPLLKPFCEQAPEHVALALLSLRMLNDDGTLESQFLAERLIRNRRAVRYMGEMHNWVEVPHDQRIIAPDLVIEHRRGVRPDHRRAERDRQRIEMARKVFYPRIEKDPNDRRSMFYLAGTLRDHGEHAEACALFEKYLNVSDWPEERYQAALFMARSLAVLQRADDAQQVMSMFLRDNWRRAEGYLLLGDLAFERRHYDEALHWYRTAQPLKLFTDPMFLEGPAYSWLPSQRLAQAYLMLGDAELARGWAKEAQRQGDPTGVVSQIEACIVEPKTEPQRLTLFVDRGQMHFIQPHIECWARDGRYDLRLWQDDGAEPTLEQALADTDIAWFEWAGPLLVKATQQPKSCRIVTRVHGYEAHSDLPLRIDWGKVDDVIYTATYLGNLVQAQAPAAVNCRRYVIHGGVDCNKFRIANGKPGNKIAMAGYLNDKKNIPLALQILAKARQRRPELELHIAGEHQDHRLAMYIDVARRELGLEGVVTLHPWQEDLNAFYADKSYILSSSIEESFHYALAEGMAAGLKPVVHCWESSRDVYPERWIFRTVDQAAEMFCETELRPDEYRSWVEGHLGFEKQHRRIERILTKPRVFVAGSTEPWAAESYLRGALDEVGCLHTEQQPQLQIVLSPAAPMLRGVPTLFWYAEQVVGCSGHARGRLEAARALLDSADHVLTSSPLCAKVLSEASGRQVHWVYLGGARPPFFRADHCSQDIDVGFVGRITPRRRAVLAALDKDGLRVATTETYDHAEVARWFARCKVNLNLHCTSECNLESRVAEVLSSGGFLLSEALPEGFNTLPERSYDEAVNLRQLRFLTRYYLERPERRQEYADRGFEAVWRTLRLEQQVEQALAYCGI